MNHHDGHIIAKDVYNSYQHVKKLSAEDEEYLIKVRAAPRNIASTLLNKTGFNFKPKDAQNIIDIEIDALQFKNMLLLANSHKAS